MNKVENVKELYNTTAAEYTKQNYIDYEYSPQKIRHEFCVETVKRHLDKNDGKFLDVGCGPGLLLADLHKEGYKCLHGIDISESMLEIAKTNVSDAVNLQLGDIANLPFEDNYFDVLVAAGVLEYQNDDSSVNELFRVLKPGGILIINVTNKLGYLHLLYPIRYALKSVPMFRGFLSFIKKRIFQKGELSAIPKRRTHIPYYFDKQLTRSFDKRIDFRYFHFSILPPPLNYFLGKYDDRLSNKLEAILGKSAISFLLSGGYIGVYKKYCS